MMNLILYFSTVLIWGTTWLAIAFQIGDTPVTLSVSYRFGLAAAVLMLLLVLKGVSLKISKKNHLFSLSLGVFLFSTNFICFYYATYYIPSGLNAVIFSLAPLLNAFNGWLFLRNTPDKRVIQGGIIGVIGVLLLFLPQILSTETNQLAILGLFLSLAGTYCFSCGNFISSKAQSLHMPLLPTTAWGMAYGSGFLLILTVAMGNEILLPMDKDYLLSLLYLAIFGSVIGFNTYLLLVGRIGPQKAAYCTVLFPIIALMLSTWFEGYKWGWPAVLGVVMVIMGNLRVFGIDSQWLNRYRLFRQRLADTSS
jgi:drug/metabolite transporter (DMT)-like permease